MKHLGTTLSGFVIGIVPVIDAVIKAYAAGQFKGETGIELVLGIAVIALGAIAHDPKAAK